MSWKKNIILSLLIVQSFSALGQYKLLLKGDRSPYDSGVVVLLSTYRAETQKMKVAGDLIDSLKIEISTLTESSLYKDSINAAQAVSVVRLTESNALKDKTISEFNTNFKNLYDEATKPRKWYEKPQTWLIGFVVIETLRIILVR